MPRRAKARPAFKRNTTPTRFQPHRTCAPRPPRFPKFLRLPPELRNQVYSNVLLRPSAIDVAHVWNGNTALDLSLFRVCRQIGTEAVQYFYRNNTFCFLEPCDEFQDDDDNITTHQAIRFMERIGSTNRLSILRLQVRMRDERDITYYKEFLTHISAMLPNIRRLGLVMERHHVSRADNTGTNANGTHHHVTHWDPNFIVPIDEAKMPALYNALVSLKLALVTVADQPDRIKFLESLPHHFGCQVKAIELKSAERNESGCVLLSEQKSWFDSPAGCYNREIRQEIRESGLHEKYFKGLPTTNEQTKEKEEEENPEETGAEEGEDDGDSVGLGDNLVQLPGSSVGGHVSVVDLD